MQSPLLSIIIPFWGTAPGLPLLLEELRQLPYTEIFVINNNSKLPVGVKDTDQIHILTMPFNSGFAKACNTGLLASKSELCLFLNPDVEISIVQISDLLGILEDEHLDAVSPELLNTTGKSDDRYQKPIPSFWSLLTEFSPLNKVIPMSLFKDKTLPGAALLIKREVLKKVGAWDERFFIWFEDSDLSQKLKTAGFKTALTSKVQVRHVGSESFDLLETHHKDKLFFCSLHQYAHKHFHWFTRTILKLLTRRFSSETLLPADSAIKLSIVVPNMKKELLQQFLHENYQAFDFSQHELIIVTSAKNIDDLEKKHPHAIWIKLEHNKGFASTVNTGLQRARGQYLGTINDDTVFTEEWMQSGLQHFTPQVGTVTPIVRKLDGSIESMGIQVLPQGKAQRLVSSEERLAPNTFNAASVLFNRSALTQVGLFDERFGSYLEDIDLGLRMTNAGWTHVTNVNASITHLGQQTSKAKPIKKAWQDCKNWWLVLVNNYSLRMWVKFFPQILLERARNCSGLLKAIFA
jgi:GT2 family glycosyltransferase